MNKTFMAAALLAFTSAAFAANGTSAPTKAKAKPTPEEKARAGFMQKGMAMTRLKLNDPQTAQFRHVFFHENADGVRVTCGEVNSKNARGEFGGFQKFVTAGSPDLTFIQAEVPAFEQIWSQYCA